MYKSFFGLTHNPFDLSPDPSFYVSTEKEREVLASIHHAVVRRKGFVVLTGEVGTGKTLAVRYLCELWKGQQIPFANVVGPRLSVIDFLAYVTFDLGIQVKESSKGSLLRALYIFLLAQFEKGVTTVLIIDEAHQLRPQVLEEIRLLTNFETAQQKLLQVLLVGQPELDTKLDSFELRQLKQRIAIRCRLEPLLQESTYHYIQRRLALAGAKANSIFPAETVEVIFRYSSGIPRLINNICEQALVAAYARQVRAIPVEIIDEVASYLRLPPIVNHSLTGTFSSMPDDNQSPLPGLSGPKSTGDDLPEEDLRAKLLSTHSDSSTVAPGATQSTGIAHASGPMEWQDVQTSLTASDVTTIETGGHSPITTASATEADSLGVAEVALDEASTIGGASKKAQEPLVGETLAQKSSDAHIRLAGDSILQSPDAAPSQALSPRLNPLIAADNKGTFIASQKIVLAGIALVSILVGGGILWFRSGVTGNAAGKPALRTGTLPVATQIGESFTARAADPILRLAARPRVTSNPTPAVRETPIVVTGKSAKETVVAREQPEQPEPKDRAKQPVLNMSGTLNAHPISPQYASAEPATPAMGGLPPGGENTLDAIASAPIAGTLPPPRVEANSSRPVDARIREPRILSQVLPVYPPVAREAHTEGDVVVEIVVDKKGNVGNMKVVSGPALLRQAALDALRRWKYEPSMLDGQPISAQMLVTITFQP